MIIELSRGQLSINPAYLIGAFYEGQATGIDGYLVNILIAINNRSSNVMFCVYDTKEEALDMLNRIDKIIEDFNNGVID